MALQGEAMWGRGNPGTQSSGAGDSPPPIAFARRANAMPSPVKGEGK